MNISAIELSKEEERRQYKKLQTFSPEQLQVLRKNATRLHVKINQILTSATSNDPRFDQNNFIDTIYTVLDSNYTDPNFGVEDLSAAMFLSRSQLFRKLKTLIKETPNNLIRIYRLKKACSLLESYDGTASEIAYKVEFKNPSYFFKCFKDEFGITPKDYMFTSF